MINYSRISSRYAPMRKHENPAPEAVALLNPSEARTAIMPCLAQGKPVKPADPDKTAPVLAARTDAGALSAAHERDRPAPPPRKIYLFEATKLKSVDSLA